MLTPEEIEAVLDEVRREAFRECRGAVARPVGVTAALVRSRMSTA